MTMDSQHAHKQADEAEDIGQQAPEGGLTRLGGQLYQPQVLAIEDRTQWMAEREKTVGASEIAALFQIEPEEDRSGDYFDEDGAPVSPYETPLSLWAYKSGRITRKEDENTNNRVKAGTLLEPVIAQLIADENGWTFRKPAGYYLHPENSRLGASLDFEVDTEIDGTYVPFEIKNVAASEIWKWKNGVGDWVVPDWIQLQVQHQMLVTGHQRAIVGVLFGGNEPRHFEIFRDPELCNTIWETVNEFWAHVDNGVMPDVNFERDTKVIRKLYFNIDPKERVEDWTDHAEAQALIQQRAHHSAQANFHKKEADAITNRIFMLLGDAKAAVLGEQIFSTHHVKAGKVAYEREAYRGFSLRKNKPKSAGKTASELAKAGNKAANKTAAAESDTEGAGDTATASKKAAAKKSGTKKTGAKKTATKKVDETAS